MQYEVEPRKRPLAVMQLWAFFVGKLTEAADVSPLQIGVEPRLSVPLDESLRRRFCFLKRRSSYVTALYF